MSSSQQRKMVPRDVLLSLGDRQSRQQAEYQLLLKWMMGHDGHDQKVIRVRQWVPGGLGGGLAAWNA